MELLFSLPSTEGIAAWAGQSKLGISSWSGLSSHGTQVPVGHNFCATATPGRLVAGTSRRGRAICALTRTRQTTTAEPENLEKEAHKYFDQVVITVRSGDGGHGSVLDMPKSSMPPPRKVRGQKDDKAVKKEKKTGALKRSSDGSLLLPMGGHGGDVVLVADESMDTLLELHKKKRYNAKRGANVDETGPLTPMLRDGASASTLRISVPVGTVVKRKRGGKLLADLSQPGDSVTVARGGRGGISMLELPKGNRRPLKNVNAAIITDPDDKVLVLGSTGEEIVLELTLRIVADVGLVGFPNAGKSSLLAAVTRAKPDIADYPFTTLMPNLGRLKGSPDKDDGGFASGPTLADLPGLIKGAHLGKGLGRMFLRHLRRTRLLLHVVDASKEDPIRDYKILREELYMYNPEYVTRPHIVVLNKLDLPEAKERMESLRETISKLGIDPETIEIESAVSTVTPGVGDDAVSTVIKLSKRLPIHFEEEWDDSESSSSRTLEKLPVLMDEGSNDAEIHGTGTPESLSTLSVVGSDGAGRTSKDTAKRLPIHLEGGISTHSGKVFPEILDNLQTVKADAFRDDDRSESVENFRRPVAVVGISARQGLGIEELLSSIRVALEDRDAQVKTKPRKEAKPRLYKAPQWQI